MRLFLTEFVYVLKLMQVMASTGISSTKKNLLIWLKNILKLPYSRIISMLSEICFFFIILLRIVGAASEFIWRFTVIVFKQLIKMSSVLISYHITYSVYFQVCFQKKLAGCFKSSACQVCNKGFTHAMLEKRTEINGIERNIRSNRV